MLAVTLVSDFSFFSKHRQSFKMLHLGRLTGSGVFPLQRQFNRSVILTTKLSLGVLQWSFCKRSWRWFWGRQQNNVCLFWPLRPWVRTGMQEERSQVTDWIFSQSEEWSFLWGPSQGKRKGADKKVTVLHTRHFILLVGTFIWQQQQQHGKHNEIINNCKASQSIHENHSDNAEDFRLYLQTQNCWVSYKLRGSSKYLKTTRFEFSAVQSEGNDGFCFVLNHFVSLKKIQWNNVANANIRYANKHVLQCTLYIHVHNQLFF